MYKRFFKRILDLVFSVLGFLLLSPIFLIVMVTLLISNRGNPFFVQPRPGKQGHIFRIIKFKTMNDHVDENGNLLPDSKRLTPVGRLIRKTSLDEMPQLLNVIQGHMSLVGPRPLLVDYLPLYNELQQRRHEVKPGITGWAQVNGRNAKSWDQKFELDLWYVKNLSLSLDIKILFKTLKKLFKSNEVNYPGHSTMPYFTGNKTGFDTI